MQIRICLNSSFPDLPEKQPYYSSQLHEQTIPQTLESHSSDDVQVSSAIEQPHAVLSSCDDDAVTEVAQSSGDAYPAKFDGDSSDILPQFDESVFF